MNSTLERLDALDKNNVCKCAGCESRDNIDKQSLQACGVRELR